MVRKMTAAPFYLRGKKSIVLDLHDEDDLAVCRELAAGSDVVIEAFGAGDAERLGLGYDVLEERNQGLVYTSISGFGHQGPFRSPQVIRGSRNGQDGLDVWEYSSAPRRSTGDARSLRGKLRGSLLAQQGTSSRCTSARPTGTGSASTSRWLRACSPTIRGRTFKGCCRPVTRTRSCP